MWLLMLIAVLILVSALYGYKRWGASNEKAKQAKRVARDRKKDAVISGKPYVDKPFGRMRSKK